MANDSKAGRRSWQPMSVSVIYQEAAPAIDFLTRAFGFEVRLRVDIDGGKVAHAELELGGGVIMVGDGKRDQRPYQKSPREVGGANTAVVGFYVDDVEAHCARARAAGATIVQEPTTNDYGEDYWTDRTYEAVDHEGHHWWFTQRMRG